MLIRIGKWLEIEVSLGSVHLQAGSFARFYTVCYLANRGPERTARHFGTKIRCPSDEPGIQHFPPPAPHRPPTWQQLLTKHGHERPYATLGLSRAELTLFTSFLSACHSKL